MLGRLKAAALLPVVAMMLLAPTGAQARTDTRTKPVVFVHGLDAVGDPGVSCSSTFATMENKLRALGQTGTFDTVGYYEYDTGCNHSINAAGGNPGSHYASGHYADGGHGANTDIRHLGYHLAWYVYNTYSSKGITVDLVGHSMGGLMIRYAVGGVAQRLSGFPPYLYVEDGLTMGSPHGGARTAVWLCPFTECDQMHPGSNILVWMQDYAWNPGGVDWTTMGSDDDNYVAADRAVGTNTSRTANQYFGNCHKVWYQTSANLEHSDYMNDTSDSLDADVYRASDTNCGGALVQDLNFRHAVREADQALTYGTH